MKTEALHMNVTLTYSDDMDNTFSIDRLWDDAGKKALIIMLYPTIGTGRLNEMDSSTCLLLNHMNDFEFGGITIVNIYSKVFGYKPGVKDLDKDEDNLKFLNEIMKSADIQNRTVIIAWGSAYATHKVTLEMKLEILRMLQRNKIEAYHIVPEFADETMRQGIHPLYLGLHHSREKWSLLPFDTEFEIGLITKELDLKSEKKELSRKKGGTPVVSNKK